MSVDQSQPTASSGTSGVPNSETQAVVPRDVRLLHLIFATQGIQNYQDHVPLQLMDFAYSEYCESFVEWHILISIGYTTSVLRDAKIYSDHARVTHVSNAGNQGTNQPLTTDDIRLAISARTNYQFKPTPPKELMLELAAERNKKPLPPVMPTWGIRLPPEKYCLTAKDWNLSDEEVSMIFGV